VVGHDWLAELAAVAHSEERTACASPLVNVPGTCSVSESLAQSAPWMVQEALVRKACALLPRWTVAPVLTAACIYLRGDVLDAVGTLDVRYATPSDAVDHWVLRAQALGFAAKRCNRVYVHRHARGVLAEERTLNLARAPSEIEKTFDRRRQVDGFSGTLDARMAAHAVRLETTGRIRVAYDIRHLTRPEVGTRVHALGLGRALADLPQVELSLLVREPAQAEGIAGRVVVAHDWCDDVALIHKPAQVTEATELELLFNSRAHLVITYQDLIGYRTAMAFPTDEEFEEYRATSSLALQAVQHVLAFSNNAALEIAAEFGVPREDISVVPLGVDAAWFADRSVRDVAIRRELNLPARYFFSVATDFPHKNVANLLDAYAILRDRWRDGTPPALVLAGYSTGGRSRLYRSLTLKAGRGLRFLGPVTREQLRVLYQDALALVFSSLYEGFGLPPLEAMAAGTPVIAMPISSVPEVGGDCVLYPAGLSPASLARAMESLASDLDLRHELRARGLERVDEFRWENTARAIFDVYRATIARPKARSLQMRRLLRDTIIRWAHDSSSAVPPGSVGGMSFEGSIGIRNAWKVLSVAIGKRLSREFNRLPIASPRMPARTRNPGKTETKPRSCSRAN
jgi:glycosyltransferase involved in cell wall biosynthesis